MNPEELLRSFRRAEPDPRLRARVLAAALRPRRSRWIWRAAAAAAVVVIVAANHLAESALRAALPRPAERVVVLGDPTDPNHSVTLSVPLRVDLRRYLAARTDLERRLS